MNFTQLRHSLRKVCGAAAVLATADGSIPFRTIAQARSALEERDFVPGALVICPVLHQLRHWILVFRDREGRVGVFDSSLYQHRDLKFCGPFCLFAVAALLHGYSTDSLHALLNGVKGGGALDSFVLDSVVELFELVDDSNW